MNKLFFDAIENLNNTFVKPLKSVGDPKYYSPDLTFSKLKEDRSLTTAVVFNRARVSLLLISIFLIFVLRLIYLQVFNYQYFLAASKENKIRRTLVYPERGVVYDKNQDILVRNKPSFSVQLNASACRISLCQTALDYLSEYIPLDKEKIKSQIKVGQSNFLLATNIPKDVVLKIESFKNNLPGVSVEIFPLRDYLYKDAFAHTLGYTGLDDSSILPIIVGKSGIEQSYDKYLRGVFGFKVNEIDSTGQIYTQISQTDALPGRNIYTYLDKNISLLAYEELKKVVDAKKATGGAVVAQDPRSGGVYALVSYPSFDPGLMSEGISSAQYEALLNDPGHLFFNRAVSAAYPPGSVFKLVMASAGLTEKTITPFTTIYDPGFINVNGYIFRNWKLDGHGDVDLVRALQVSNDTYFYTVGGGYSGVPALGIQRIHDWSLKFGFGKSLGLDIQGELPGFVPDGKYRDWYLGDTYITSIGQGDLLATPIQVNSMTAYFAGKGVSYKPMIVKQIEGESANAPVVLAKDIISNDDFNTIEQGLIKAVTLGGTAYPLFDFTQKHKGIILAGKTGTSEFIKPDGTPATHAWLTVYGPVGNSSIVLTVFLEGGGAGSDDAAPIARQLLDEWFK